MMMMMMMMLLMILYKKKRGSRKSITRISVLWFVCSPNSCESGTNPYLVICRLGYCIHIQDTHPGLGFGLAGIVQGDLSNWLMALE